jgi:hypothetical protein
MQWLNTKFIEWPCLEATSGRHTFRVFADQPGRLYHDSGLSTAIHECESLNAAKTLAHELCAEYSRRLG